jgi:hypothetical protein
MAVEESLKLVQFATDYINRINLVVSINLEMLSFFRRVYELVTERFPNKKYTKALDELFELSAIIKCCIYYGFPDPNNTLEGVLIPRIIKITNKIDKRIIKDCKKLLDKLMKYLKENKEKTEKDIYLIYLKIYSILTYLIMYSAKELFMDRIEKDSEIKADEKIQTQLEMVEKFDYFAGEIAELIAIGLLIDTVRYEIKLK